MKWMIGQVLTATVLATTSAHAQYTDGIVKIGVLTDRSSLYSDENGPGSVASAKLVVGIFCYLDRRRR
jgi:branched-chain amino acid transport system substrate-binding protein